jgi:TPR repeat protein
MRTFFALLLLIAIPRPASADFAAAEAAVKRGEYPSAYLACKSEAEVGDAECQHLVGYLYQEGLGVPLNATEAIRLFRRAAKRGLAIAQCHLGFAYERGFGVSPDDFEAVHWYRLAAAQGDPIGEYFMAFSLLEGRGVAKDRGRAIELLQHAADRGLSCLERGSVVDAVAGHGNHLAKPYKTLYRERHFRWLAACPSAPAGLVNQPRNTSRRYKVL